MEEDLRGGAEGVLEYLDEMWSIPDDLRMFIFPISFFSSDMVGCSILN